MDKKTWRNKIFSEQEKLTDKIRNELSQRIFGQVVSYQSWRQAGIVALYHSVGKEVDTLSLLEEGWKANKRMYLPKCFPQERRMAFYKVDSFEQFEVVYMGIPEPKPELCTELELEQLDLMIVPGVVFDREGYRLGYGGGYYDRFLERAPDTFEKLSLAFSFQVVEGALPRDPYDIPINTLITEHEIIVCKQTRKGERDGGEKTN